MSGLSLTSLAGSPRTWFQHPETTYFSLFALLHVALWTVAAELTQPNAPLDTIELFYWGRQWEWGYYKHPPLPAWVLYGTSSLWGVATWPSYLLSQLATLVCFWAVWRLAQSALSPRLALLAPLLLEGSYYYNFTTPEFNNNVMSRCCWALVIWGTYRAMATGHPLRWIMAGLFLALGMLSKYDMALLATSLLLFSVIHPGARRHWGTVGPWLMLATLLLVMLPHIVWMVEHRFATLQYVAERSGAEPGWERHLFHPLKFGVGQLLAISPMLLLAQPILVARRSLPVVSSVEYGSRFLRDYVLAVTLIPFSLILLLSLATGIRVRSMWGSPLWTFVPLALLLTLELRDSVATCRAVAWRCGMACLLFALAFMGRNLAGPYVREKGSAIHYPGRPLARLVEQRWQATCPGHPLQWVGGSWWPAANVTFYLNQTAGVYANLDSRISPWLDDTRFRRSGGVILWQHSENEGSRITQLKRRFPQAALLEPLRADWQTGANLPPVELSMMIVPPDSESHTLTGQRASVR